MFPSLSQANERGLHPKATINCAGYKALASMEEYMELINTSLPGRRIQRVLNPCSSNMAAWQVSLSFDALGSPPVSGFLHMQGSAVK